MSTHNLNIKHSLHKIPGSPVEPGILRFYHTGNASSWYISVRAMRSCPAVLG